MPPSRLLLPGFALAIPLTLLPLLGCGIFALPFSAPAVAARNLRTLRFMVDIIDDAGTPLRDVTVEVTRYGEAVDPLMVSRGDYTTDAPLTIHGTFTAESHGKYALIVKFSKPGYQPECRTYSHDDHADLRSAAILTPPPSHFYPGPHVNITTHPRSTVILHPAGDGAGTPAEAPAGPAIDRPPGQPYPTHAP